MKHNVNNIGKNTTGFKRLPRATWCSLKGYYAAWKYESGFRQYLILSAITLPFSYYLALSTTHLFVLIGSLVFLLFAEIINSAIEAIADAVIPEYNELIGRAKDLGSAGVFTALMFALIVWGNAIYCYLK